MDEHPAEPVLAEIAELEALWDKLVREGGPSGAVVCVIADLSEARRRLADILAAEDAARRARRHEYLEEVTTLTVDSPDLLIEIPHL